MGNDQDLSNILVTGCGGDIALGIGKILRKCNIASRIFGCDILSDHAGSAYFDQCYVVERADDENYLKSISLLVDQLSVDLLIPVSEPELRRYHQDDILSSISNVPIIIANRKALSIGFDKLATAGFLEDNGFPFPWTVSVKDGPPKSLPCILKSRFSSGSRNVQVVSDESIARFGIEDNPDYIWQEHLLPDDQEYTCGLYRTAQAETRTIVLRRKLVGGLTGQGEVIRNEEIEDLLHRFAEKIDLAGSINVQLRLTDSGPVIFEINPRFSSTIVFRHLMGFQDLLWSIQERLGIQLEDYSAPQAGQRFFRLSEEYIISGEN